MAPKVAKPRGEAGVRAAAPAAAKAAAPAADPVTTELRALSKEVRTAAQLRELASQVDAIADYHLGDVQYETPGEEMERALERVVARGPALVEKGASKDAVASLQDSAMGLLGERIFAKIEPDLARLDKKQTLVPYDRDQVQWTFSRLRPLREALEKAPAGAARTEQVRAKVQEVETKLHEISARPDYVRPDTPEQKAADAAWFQRSMDAIKSKQPAGEEWRDWYEKDVATVEVWRGLMADALQLVNQPVDHLELAGSVGFGLFGRGLKLLRDHHDQLSGSATKAKTEDARAAYAELAAANAELWVRAVSSRAAYLVSTGETQQVVDLLTDPMKKASELPSPPAVLAEAIAEAQRIFASALPAALDKARDVITRGEAIFAKGEKPYAMQREAESSLIYLRKLPPETPGLAEITAQLKSLYTRAHLSELREELTESQRALAALRASAGKPGEKVLEDAASSQHVSEMLSWVRDNPHLDPALLADKPALVEAHAAIAKELEAARAKLPAPA